MPTKPKQDWPGYLPMQPVFFLQRLTSRRNAILLLRLFLAFVIIVVVHSVAFHYLARWEGHNYSPVTGIYWTLSTMTTLGLGDITFVTDFGKLFTVLVVCTGVVFLLILVPFTFIQLFQSSARVPRELPHGTRDHVILTNFDPLAANLIEKLQDFGHRYVLLVSDIAQGIQLRDKGYRTVVGELDDPNTYREVRVESAALVVAASADVLNTSLAYTVRQVSKGVPIIATASGGVAAEVLNAAGCTHVLALDEIMGQSLARRTIAGDAMAHIIGQVDELLIAEATVEGTPLVNKTLRQADLSHLAGVCVIGIWEGREFVLPHDSTVISGRSVLVLAGSQAQIDRYNELFCIYNITNAPILIVGGGNVGRAMSRALKERDVAFRIVEQSKDLIFDRTNYVQGNAADIQVLRDAGFFEAPAIAITTHDDPTNIFLTTYYRHLRENIQIISRATTDRSIDTLHSAGCSFVVSYASLGANSIVNLLKRGNILLVAEGVDVFKVRTPTSLVGRTIATSRVREESGCSIIGVSSGGTMTINPDPAIPLAVDADIVLIGTVEAEERFFDRYNPPTESE
jgi:voltage-gated potassium channel